MIANLALLHPVSRRRTGIGSADVLYNVAFSLIDDLEISHHPAKGESN